MLQVHFLLIQHKTLKMLRQTVPKLMTMIYVLFSIKFKTKLINNQFYFRDLSF